MQGNPRRKTSFILFRYVFQQYITLLVCCVIGFCLLFLVFDLLDDLSDFLEANASLKTICKYFLLRQPLNLVHVLPMTVLLSTSYLLNSLGMRGELIGIRSSGISMIRFCLPIWLLALICAGILFRVENTGPAYATRAREIQNHITEKGTRKQPSHARLAFRNTETNTEWFFEQFQLGGPQRGISVKRLNPEDGFVRWEIRAEKGVYKDGKWKFFKGAKKDYNPESNLPSGKGSQFKVFVAEDLGPPPSKISQSLRPVEELSLHQINGILENSPHLPKKTRNNFRTIVWYRWSYPLSCLVAALAATALALAHERSGKLLGIALAIGVLVLYYFIAHGCVVLGKNGFIPPILAGSLPTACFIVGSTIYMYFHR